MRQRTRKLVGTVALLLLVAVYALLMTGLAAAILPNAGQLTQLVYYAVAGLAWVPPAAMIVSWMHGGATD